MKSWKTPTAKLVEKAVSRMMRKEQQRYFFEHLENPKWLEPLREKGFFSNPPEPIPHEKEGTVSFVAWPASGYLARMGKHDPETVCKFILSIPKTENPYVHLDFVNAALEMPPQIAVRLVKRACEWVRQRFHFASDQYGELIVHLARGNETESALKFASCLLEVVQDPRPVSPKLLEFDPSYRHHATSRIPDWEYEQILRKQVPALVREVGLPALELLCGLLENAIALGRHEGPDEGKDYSYSWRLSIEGEDGIERLKNNLVTAVRNAAISLVESSPETSTQMLDLLEGRRFTVFSRIALYMLRRFPEIDQERVAQRITDRKLFDDIGVRHEYYHLSQRCFGNLSEEEKNEVLGWIDRGLDRQHVIEREKNIFGSTLTDEETDRIIDQWRLEGLSPIREHLPPDWKRRYESLVEKLGLPKHPDYPVHRTGGAWVGPRSPKPVEALKEMLITELVEFVRTWQAEQDIFAASPEGLGREITKLIGENPEKYAAQALSFEGLAPTYVRGFLQGLVDACKAKKVFPWKPVLELCSWVASQPRDTFAPKRGIGEADPHWGWARQTVASLLSAGFESDEIGIPFELRTSAWTALEPIARDPDPSTEYEKQYGGENLDPLTMSINTTRGNALHAVMRYALWCRKNLTSRKENVDLEALAEVRTILEEHLNPSNDPALAIRAIYGEWLPWIVLLDAEWVRINLTKIFPPENELGRLWEAAWETYVIVNSAYDNVFAVLQDQYRRAVNEIGISREGRRLLSDPDDGLAEHLMQLYWRGKIDLEDPKGILVAFYQKADDSLRAHAMNYFGRSVESSPGEIPTIVIERLKNLWKRRVEQAELEPDKHTGEMAAFGWWFESRKFGDEWALSQLEKALRLSAGTIDPELHAMQCLATLVQDYPQQVIRCTKLLIEGDRTGWNITLWREDVRKILDIALRSGVVGAAEIARNLINLLGTRGFHDYRDLLQLSS